MKLLTLAVGGRRHVVLPQEVAKLLPKGKLMKEVRARWRDVAFAEAGGGRARCRWLARRGEAVACVFHTHCRRIAGGL